MATVVRSSGRHGAPRGGPRQSFETWQWFFMRISGLVLWCSPSGTSR